MSQVLDFQSRETKDPQAGPHIPVSELFRLGHRSIVGGSTRQYLGFLENDLTFVPVTGAAGGLGTELVAAILESGGDVVAIDLAETPPTFGWEKVRDVAKVTGTRLYYFSCDVADDESVIKTFEKIFLSLRYPIRGLVACAGISDFGPAVDFTSQQFRHILDVNVMGTFNVAQAVARQMTRDNVSGSIVLVASMSGHVSNKGIDTAGYNSSKAALHQLTRSLAAEWGSRINMPLIRVNSLSPGYIRTAATTVTLEKPGLEAQWRTDNMLFRLSTTDEFRGPVLFLLGDGSSFMTGADLRVDGGHCAW